MGPCLQAASRNSASHASVSPEQPAKCTTRGGAVGSLSSLTRAAAREAGEPMGKSPGVGTALVADRASLRPFFFATFIRSTVSSCCGQEPLWQGSFTRIAFQLIERHSIEQVVQVCSFSAFDPLPSRIDLAVGLHRRHDNRGGDRRHEDRATRAGVVAGCIHHPAHLQHTDGGGPAAPPIQASDGNLYGTASGGGTTGSGTIFKITSTGTLTTVHNFDPKNGDGAFPQGLVQHTNGIFYGRPFAEANCVPFLPRLVGTLFSLSVP